ncbi:Rab6-interacting golgin-like [Plakobranchus ocellatus]|uniref:RAB6-interacting golgin n=1 Tax=Plakobranchus ocellatus TaxID=259542 RepID=A0AAV3Z9W5_9GAST|nr:Rab6-interacting golgin-like [Plakobranchus ocellatus]
MAGSGWSGFTDEDLRKMKVTAEKDEASRSNAQRQAQAAARRQRQAQQRAMTTPVSGKRHSTKGETETSPQLDPSMKLGGQTNKQRQGNQSTESSHKETSAHQNGPAKSEIAAVSGSANGTQVVEKEVKELDETEALNVELGNVQKFQQQQKVIEEANKQKRALLAKAIEDRRKRAKAEADKLVRVQQELNHLDSLLTADVGIIRDKIEVASLEYMEAQKRYEKAEKEFVAAKMDLFYKGEAKESLTEHLYTIIHQNEVRKARKLVELMEKLAMEVTPEEMELTIPAIPQLSNFTAVATLHDPNSPHHPLNLAQHQQQAVPPSPGKQQQPTGVSHQLQQPEQKHTQDQQRTEQQQQQQQLSSEHNAVNKNDSDQTSQAIPSENVTTQATPDSSSIELLSQETVNPTANLDPNGTVGLDNFAKTSSENTPCQTDSSKPEQPSIVTPDLNPSSQSLSQTDNINNNIQSQDAAGKTANSTVSEERTNADTKADKDVENGDVGSAEIIESESVSSATTATKTAAKGWLNPFT